MNSKKLSNLIGICIRNLQQKYPQTHPDTFFNDALRKDQPVPKAAADRLRRYAKDYAPGEKAAGGIEATPGFVLDKVSYTMGLMGKVVQ
jgi:hypothetical protein